MAFIRDKPAYNKFAFRNLTEVDYKIQARGYSKAECQVTLVIYAWKSGAGVLYIVQGVSKGVVIDYSKRKLAGFCLALGALGWVTGFNSFHKFIKNRKTL